MERISGKTDLHGGPDLIRYHHPNSRDESMGLFANSVSEKEPHFCVPAV